ncbi:MAG: hypothetical protein KatS3mg092_0445 [Patescibacteria group bacterium]|nr:MAG: hypothetical protein KatS3mg092_0445 [Patescibacteria group bacterium]
MTNILVYDPTASDSQSTVRGVGRYLQILKENFPNWKFSNTFHVPSSTFHVFINPFFNFLRTPLTMKKIAKKQIAVIHDLIPLKYPDKFPAGIRGNINIFLNKIALKNYDLIITDSYASKKDIVEILKISENKVKVIYPCLPKIFKIKNQKSKVNPPTGGQNENLKLKIENFILYVGDATWNKNLVNLAKAIKIANVTCVFVGKVFNIRSKFHVTRSTKFNPWQKELREFLKEVVDDKRFIFLGYVNDDQLIKLYQQAKVNILISRDEGFGFSYLEASSQSCPSIISDIPVLKEVSDNQGVIIANPNDPNDIADKIIEIYFDKNLKAKLSNQAFNRSQFFSAYIFKKVFFDIIKFL